MILYFLVILYKYQQIRQWTKYNQIKMKRKNSISTGLVQKGSISQVALDKITAKHRNFLKVNMQSVYANSQAKITNTYIANSDLILGETTEDQTDQAEFIDNQLYESVQGYIYSKFLFRVVALVKQDFFNLKQTYLNSKVDSSHGKNVLVLSKSGVVLNFSYQIVIPRTGRNVYTGISFMIYPQKVLPNQKKKKIGQAIEIFEGALQRKKMAEYFEKLGGKEQQIQDEFSFGSIFNSIKSVASTVFSYVKPAISIANSLIETFDGKSQSAIMDFKEAFSNQSSTLNKEMYEGPIWQVGLIEVVSQNQKQPIKRFTFTGTLIDNVTILTSSHYLKPDDKLVSGTIRLTGQTFTRQLSTNFQVYKTEGESNVLTLFLKKPYEIEREEWITFKYITESTFFYKVTSKKVKMIGYNNHKLMIQESRIMRCTSEYIVDSFDKGKHLVGSPLIFEDVKKKKFYIFGICNSQQNLSSVLAKTDTDLNKGLKSIASVTLNPSVVHEIFKDSNIRSLEINLNREKAKRALYRSLQLASIIDQQAGAVYPTTINSVAILNFRRKSNSQNEKYGIGVIIGQNKLVTLNLYADLFDKFDTFIYTKNQTASNISPYYFDLKYKNNFDELKLEKVTKQNQYIEVQFSHATKVKPKATRQLSNQDVLNLDELKGFILDIKESNLQNQEIILQKTILNNFSDIASHNYKDQIKGLIFAYEEKESFRKDFYIGTTQERDYKPESLIKATEEQTEKNEGIFYGDMRKRILNGDVKNSYYSAVVMIINLNNCSSGTGVFLKDSQTNKCKMILTCAHNFYWNSQSIDYSVKAQHLDKYRFRRNLSKEFQSETEYDRSIKIDQVILHPDYIKMLDTGENWQDKHTCDIALIILKDEIQNTGFSVLYDNDIKNKIETGECKKIFEKLSPFEKENIEISGFPGTEIDFHSKAGILYTEKFKDKKMAFVEVKRTASDKSKIQHNLSTLPGNSGSPIFYSTESSKRYVLGVHNSGSEFLKENYGVYLYEPTVWEWLYNNKNPNMKQLFQAVCTK